MSKLIINEGNDATGASILSYGNWNFHGGILRNCTVFTTLSEDSKPVEAQSIFSTNKELRVLLEDIKLENGEAVVLNPYPDKSYAIASIVKKGRGDVWIDSEEEKFIIKSDNDIKVNIELIIRLEELK